MPEPNFRTLNRFTGNLESCLSIASHNFPARLPLPPSIDADPSNSIHTSEETGGISNEGVKLTIVAKGYFPDERSTESTFWASRSSEPTTSTTKSPPMSLPSESKLTMAHPSGLVELALDGWETHRRDFTSALPTTRIRSEYGIATGPLLVLLIPDVWLPSGPGSPLTDAPKKLGARELGIRSTVRPGLLSNAVVYFTSHTALWWGSRFPMLIVTTSSWLSSRRTALRPEATASSYLSWASSFSRHFPSRVRSPTRTRSSVTAQPWGFANSYTTSTRSSLLFTNSCRSTTSALCSPTSTSTSAWLNGIITPWAV
eukprot:RCo033362